MRLPLLPKDKETYSEADSPVTEKCRVQGTSLATSIPINPIHWVGVESLCRNINWSGRTRDGGRTMLPWQVMFTVNTAIALGSTLTVREAICRRGCAPCTSTVAVSSSAVLQQVEGTVTQVGRLEGAAEGWHDGRTLG